jgi:hypothetical protein
MTTDPQKSEVHESTADASSSPTGDADERATRRTRGASPAAEQPAKLPLNPPDDIRIVKDETDDGGPLVVESSDPDLNPPRTPKDPFPTLRTPEIDPPIKNSPRP